MNIDRVLYKAKLEFDINIKNLEFMMTVGAISLSDKDVSIRVTYKKNVLFNSFYDLSFGNMIVDDNSFDVLTLEQQEIALNNLAKILLKK